MTETKGGEVSPTDYAVYLHGEDLDPDLVSSVLGVPPDRSWRAGEPTIDRQGKVRGQKKAGMWSLRRETSDDSFPQDILVLLRRLASENISISGIPGVEEAYLDISQFVEPDGSGAADMELSLSKDTISLLHAAGLELQVTFGVVPE